MILALAAAFQLAAAAPGDISPRPSILVVKDATRSVSVALVSGVGGPLLRAEQLKPIVPIKPPAMPCRTAAWLKSAPRACLPKS